MHRIYLGVGWAIILLGVVHILSATRIYSEVTAGALWFVSGGIAIVLLGALNLLTEKYGTIAPGVRRVCVSANVVMTVFGVTTGVVTGGSVMELVVIGTLLSVATMFSSFGRTA